MQPATSHLLPNKAFAKIPQVSHHVLLIHGPDRSLQQGRQTSIWTFKAVD